MKGQSRLKYLKRRRLRFLPLMRVLNLFSGEYPSVYKGEGEDFVDLRPYQSGDDAKRIHWPQYAKTRNLFVIERVVQKNLTIMPALDLSRSMGWSEQKLDTVDVFFEILIGSLIRGGSNSLGLLGFSAGIERYFPPQSGRTRFVQILRWYLDYIPKESLTNIPKALNFIVKKVKPRSVVFFISDFFETRDFEQELRVAAQTFDFVPVVVQDPKEFALFAGTRVAHCDIESGQVEDLWLTQERVEEIKAREAARQERLKALFKRYKLNPIFLDSPDIKTVVSAIHDFFAKRFRRKR